MTKLMRITRSNRKTRARLKLLVVMTLTISVMSMYILARVALTEQMTFSQFRFVERNTYSYRSDVTKLSLLRVSCDDQVVHLAVCVRSVEDARHAAAMLKTVFRSGTVPLDLHVIVGSEQMFRTTSTLLDTWELNRVNFTVHRVSEDLVDEQRWPIVKFLVDKLLPITAERILYISNSVRLLDDVAVLWRHVFADNVDISSDVILHTVASVDNPKSVQFDILGINLVLMRQLPPETSLSETSSPEDLDTFFKRFQDRISTTIDCGWTVRLQSDISLSACLPVRGVLWTTDSSFPYSGNDLLESIKETVMTIAMSEFVDQVREPFSTCASEESASETVNSINAPALNSCDEYRRVARLKRRTHLNFVVGVGDVDVVDTKTSVSMTESYSSASVQAEMPLPRNSIDVSLTLATLLTMDRFASFERMLTRWDGPVSVVLYVTDDEAGRLPAMIEQSEALKDRSEISFHVVYKRLQFFPINYLRNIAVNNTRTTHVVFIDVDFVPSAGLHQQLKTWIERFLNVDGETKPLNGSDNMAFVIPAFSTDVFINVPTDKNELVDLFNKGVVNGYSLQRKWNLGHKPTNFTYWMDVKEPYYVTYHDAFEPYVVVPVGSSPRFNELMLERFADKAMYVMTLHAVGFKLCVLPDVFIVHLPHKTSAVYQLMEQNHEYERCSLEIPKLYRKELSSRYPNVIF